MGVVARGGDGGRGEGTERLKATVYAARCARTTRTES
jgi:hypothetical protein